MARATWFWHFWVAGVATLLLGLVLPYPAAGAIVFAVFVLRETRDALYHATAADMPVDHWLTDGLLDLVGPALVLWLALGWGA